MRTAITFTLLLCLVTALMPQAARAAGFACPWQPVADKPGNDMAKLLPSGAALGSAAEIDAAVQTLRRQGISSGAIVDGLISAYCPAVATDSGLTDAQKLTALQAYAARIRNIVYTYQGAEEIILDIPLPPGVVAAIQSRARAQGMSVETWVAGIVEHAVAGGATP
jgi:hypothetical protein